jgi:carboxymethylenebutenolidase
MLHLTTDVPKPADYSNQSITKHFYKTSSTYFVLPHAAQYDPAHASLAHSKTLVFLRKNLGGPFFDIEAIWEEHTYFEFEVRSVAKTMGTMVVRSFCRPCVLPRLRVALLRLNHMSIIFLL